MRDCYTPTLVGQCRGATVPKSKTRFVSGSAPGRWSLPATHSQLWKSQVVITPRKASLNREAWQRANRTQRSSLMQLSQIWMLSEGGGVGLQSSHLPQSFASWPGIIALRERHRLPSSQREQLDPCSPSGQAWSSHMQLTAVRAPGLRRPSHGCPVLLAFPRDSCSLARGSSKRLAVSWGRGRGGWGLGHNTCGTVLDSSAYLSLLGPCKRGKLLFQPEIGISVLPQETSSGRNLQRKADVC